MKFPLLLLPPAMFPLWAADTVAPVPYAEWVQGGAAVVVSGLLIYILVKVIPAKDKGHQDAEDRHLKAFQETLDVVCQRHTDEVKGIRESQAEDMRELREVMTRLAENIQHLTVNCAKVHAVKRDED